MEVDVAAWSGLKLGERIGSGHRSDVWRAVHHGVPVAVRRSRRSPESLRWELDLLADLDAAGFAVPVPVVCDGGRRHVGDVVVQRWLDGRKPSDDRDWRLVADELARLHRFGRTRPQRPGCLCTGELTATGRSVDADLSALPDSVADELVSVFAACADIECSLVHGDPGPDNIRIGADDRVGLLDWDEARVDAVYHDLSNLGIQVLSDREHRRAQRLSHAWEAANGWEVEPDYARQRLTRLRALDAGLDDWVRATNIANDHRTYELENEAIARDGRLDQALAEIAPWSGARLVDVGCGTGFWLPRYARTAREVIGVEPDPDLVVVAESRLAVAGRNRVAAEVRRGSAEHLPIPDGCADVVHARFAYFFGPGAEAGLAEVERILAPGGSFVAIDNSWSGGDFARLLTASTVANAALNPEATDRWWSDRGATRHEIRGGWVANSVSELDRILRIEFPGPVVDEFMAGHDSPALTYRFALYHWRPN